MDELKVIFGPMKQRNAEELERAEQIKKSLKLSTRKQRPSASGDG